MTVSDRTGGHARPRSPLPLTAPLPPRTFVGSRTPVEARRRVPRAPVTAALAAAGALGALYGAALATSGTGEPYAPGAGPAALLRAGLYLALAVLLGEAAGARMARTLPEAPGPPPPSRATWAALAGVVCAEAQLLLLDGGGFLDGGPGGGQHLDVYGTRTGGLAHLAANGFLLAALCLGTGRRAWAPVPLAAVVVAEALRAHPEDDTPLVGALLTATHLTAAALWVGGLLYVLRVGVLWRGHPYAVRALLLRWARLAAAAFTAVAVTGTCSTLRRLPPEEVLKTAYGRTLLVKLALFAAVSALALAARRGLTDGGGERDGDRERRGGREGEPGPDGPGCDQVLRPARVEWWALAAVVVVSAVLTVVPVPTPG
ncbi:CopD family protein [Streptomyces sp. Z26]|uniref:CopD family protein n=1 Tax=Streptomyces sp. Z26 TaxID=2500177 RepID=UPI001F0C02FA|nr:CopD family protein [Streptomyces sp. Z26]